MVLSDALAVQSQGYQGSKVSSLKVVWDLKNCFGISKNVLGSQKIIWCLKKCFGVSKNALGSQKMYWYLKKMVEIVDNVEIVDIVLK